MKRFLILLPLLTGVLIGTVSPITLADEAPAPKAEKKVKKGKKDEDSPLPAVKAAMQELEFVSGKPSDKAKYYIYLHSASWCGPCKALMPEIVKDYKKMKKKKVEVILIGHDKTEDAAKEYLKHYDADFPCLLYASSAPPNPSPVTQPNSQAFLTLPS